MRIEVLVGSEDPLIFPLKSSKVIIGSGDNCDVVVDASGISRKHIAVITEGDQYFVIDQGSTNGSFLNEERLVPGKRTEFTSFFPVRLGDNVLISLLSEEDDVDFKIPFSKEKTSPNINTVKEREDSTTVIKLNDLKKVNTEKLVLERNQKREIRKKEVVAPKKTSEKSKSFGVVQLSAILLVAVAAYYNFFHLNSSEDNAGPVAQIGKVVEVEKIEEPKVATDTIPLDELPKREKFSNLLNDLKCVTDIEKYLCNTVPEAKSGLYGATQVGTTLAVLAEGSLYISEAKKFVKAPTESTPEALDAYERTVKKSAAFLLLMRYLPVLDENLIGDNKLAIGIFSNTDSIPQLQFVLAFYPKIFNREKPGMKESDLFLIKHNGEVALKAWETHFTVY